MWLVSGEFLTLFLPFHFPEDLWLCLPREQVLGRTCLMQKRKQQNNPKTIQRNSLWETLVLRHCSTCTINDSDEAGFTFVGNMSIAFSVPHVPTPRISVEFLVHLSSHPLYIQVSLVCVSPSANRICALGSSNKTF